MRVVVTVGITSSIDYTSLIASGVHNPLGIIAFVESRMTRSFQRRDVSGSRDTLSNVRQLCGVVAAVLGITCL